MKATDFAVDIAVLRWLMRKLIKQYGKKLVRKAVEYVLDHDGE